MRDEWLYARGVADDKGQLFLLLKAAELLARDGALPVNLRFACDGEEECGGHSIVEFLEGDERGADACVIFDSRMIDRGRPAFNVATRGLCYFHVRVRTGAATSTPGLFGGAGLNAIHALGRALAAVQAVDGRLPEPLRAGHQPPSDEELESWRALPTGEEELAARRRHAGRPEGRRGVLRPHVGRARARRERARGRLAAAPEDGPAGARRGERLHPARAGPGSAGDRRTRSSGSCATPRREGAEVEIELVSFVIPA